MTSLLNQPAPDFTLYNTQKTHVQLSKLHGKNIILLFFPFAFSGTCTKELCSMRDDITSYNNLNAEIFGISTDSVFTLIKYKEDQQLNFELLSDFNKTTSKAYNSLYESFIHDTKGVSKRAAFVIDQHGIIRHEEIMDKAVEIPNFENVKKVLEGLNSKSQ
jgi:glutaredoxin-dependent peroxiredoxin